MLVPVFQAQPGSGRGFSPHDSPDRLLMFPNDDRSFQRSRNLQKKESGRKGEETKDPMAGNSQK